MMREVAMNAFITAAVVAIIVELAQAVDSEKCLKLIMSFIVSIVISHLAMTEVVSSCLKMD